MSYALLLFLILSDGFAYFLDLYSILFVSF